MAINHEAWVGVVKANGTVIFRPLYLYGGVSLTSETMDNGLTYCVFFRCGEICSHVAGILFKIEACIRLKIATRACTDLPCV